MDVGFRSLATNNKELTNYTLMWAKGVYYDEKYLKQCKKLEHNALNTLSHEDIMETHFGHT